MPPTTTASGGEFMLRFSRCSADSLHLYAGASQRVGAPRHARQFSEVDDPEAADTWEGHSRTVREGEIGMLSGTNGHLLIKVVKVHDMNRGADQNCVEFDYEFRAGA
jgi:hypothetical protein